MDQHKCFACAEQNPDRIVTKTDDGWTFKFIERFVGPPGRVHGGTASMWVSFVKHFFSRSSSF